MRFKRDITYKKILSLFRIQNGSPFFNAKGLAIGIFFGCFPFFGFQTLIGVFFAKIAKGNIVLAAIGTWISNPFTYIPLYYFNYRVGSIFFNTSYGKPAIINLCVGLESYNQLHKTIDQIKSMADVLDIARAGQS